MARRLLLAGLVLAVLGLGGFAILAWRAEYPAIEPPSTADIPAEKIEAGGRVALLGNCAGCHTAKQDAPLAGGLAIDTPFGVIYSTNITPHLETGIGRWSERAFIRAMREGVSRDGRHLYPVFPYDFFARVSEADLQALYAWVMAQRPIEATAPENDLPFPFSFRPILAGWKLLFLRGDPPSRDAAKPEAWNRGAYIAESLGHCGACHTPRNLFGAVKQDQAWQGGEAEGWHAPALTAANPAPVPWTADSLFTYLRQGAHPLHGVAAGPMSSVVHDSMAHAPEADVRAVATYVAEYMGEPSRSRQDKAAAIVTAVERAEYGVVRAALPRDRPPMGSARPIRGDQLFAGACASCHHNGGPMPLGTYPGLPLSTAVAASDPRNLIHVILHGIAPQGGGGARFMPGFAAQFSNAQVVALAAYLRQAMTDGPPWEGLEKTVAELRDASGERGRKETDEQEGQRK